jgi:RHS repeat-associated protein
LLFRKPHEAITGAADHSSTMRLWHHTQLVTISCYTVTSAPQNFRHDLANPVQELSGTTPTANLLTGGLDEYFARTDSTGTSNFLTDALGSTSALTSSTGAVQTQYTFEAFGNTTQSGATATNSYMYTGRENDGTGLYYHRARYYNPVLGRFISEDPLGINSGDLNVYRYVGNNPINGSDPTGLWSPDAHDALIRHALQPCGVSENDIKKIQDASRRFDSATGGAEDWAFAHSMRSPGQSVNDAVAQRNAFIENQLEIARDQYQAGDEDFALGQFGWGIHPVMDLTSPEHTLPNGDPIVWCAPFGCKGNMGHSPWDWTHIGHERTPDITPDDYAAEDEAIRDSYSFMTGQKLACRK